MTAPTQAPESVFDSQDFYELMQAYRCAGIADLSATVANFEAVKDFCKLHTQPTQAQPVDGKPSLEALRREAGVLAGILEGMVEGGYSDLATLYTDDQGDGDAFVVRASEVLRLLSEQPAPAPWVMLTDADINLLLKLHYGTQGTGQEFELAGSIQAAFIAKQRIAP